MFKTGDYGICGSAGSSYDIFLITSSKSSEGIFIRRGFGITYHKNINYHHKDLYPGCYWSKNKIEILNRIINDCNELNFLNFNECKKFINTFLKSLVD